MLSIVCQFVSGQHEEASGMTILDGGRAHVYHAAISIVGLTGQISTIA